MNKKQTILDTALKLYVKNGYLNTPVRDIIDGSGHGTSTFYRYFKNKEDVLRALLEEFLNDILQAVDNYYESEVDLNQIEKDLRKAELHENYDGELASSQVIADFFKKLGFFVTLLSSKFLSQGTLDIYTETP